MPTYEYQCKKCQKIYEFLQRMNDPILKICPHCGSRRFTRILSAPFIMAGNKSAIVQEINNRIPQAGSSALDGTVPLSFWRPGFGVRGIKET
jgi:putative FmdB family regulatory protein